MKYTGKHKNIKGEIIHFEVRDRSSRSGWHATTMAKFQISGPCWDSPALHIRADCPFIARGIDLKVENVPNEGLFFTTDYLIEVVENEGKRPTHCRIIDSIASPNEKPMRAVTLSPDILDAL